MKEIFSVIFMNFWGYDLIIFIVALVNFIFYYKLKQSADNLYNKMHLTVFVPDGNASRSEADKDISVLRETDIVQMRNRTGNLYSIFVNLTGIFPLLGILGTVTALLSLAKDSADVLENFYGALTSTFWGLIFAIVFKFMDGVISAKIEDNEKSVALYLERNFGTHANNVREPKNTFTEVVDYNETGADTYSHSTHRDPIIIYPEDKHESSVDSLIRSIQTGDDDHERLS